MKKTDKKKKKREKRIQCFKKNEAVVPSQSTDGNL